MRRTCLFFTGIGLGLIIASPARALGAQEPAPAGQATDDAPPLSTFSIVACAADEGFWGVAVQSKVVSAGSIVPAAAAYEEVITALKAFQRANDLREKPTLDEETARALRDAIAQQDGSS